MAACETYVCELRLVRSRILGGFQRMKTLVLSDGIFNRIAALARKYDGLEFAVTLFGHRDEDRYVVNHMADPGSRARRAYGFCTGDDEFETEVFAKLRKTNQGILCRVDLNM